ncbi:TOMM precursor leader peptide-binding protein [Paractinoplanes hotanensis]|uniref:TOMM leader peptide-binding protein n=1 Tax=Paractinoplanes hotanensis TaxID=2906497 RepID=A0ABT0Y4D9_9ACTN|nr:TOMM precursor leader peptide-binding protein [Actinoplanes hotanensis]MCM4080901.1 TOMM precursor leader peptide-binding protein [Actinoplanes hotanensis]
MTRALQTAPDAPLAAAAVQLQRDLEARWSAGQIPGGEPPVVVTLGAVDVTRAPDPVRCSANVHLAGDAVLLGPWGGAPGRSKACGHCLGVRWQRLRGRTERDALEVCSGLNSAGTWPELPEYLVDAVWNVFCVLVDSPPAEGAYLDPDSAALSRITSVDLGGLRSYSVPLLREPLCPSCAGAEPDGAPPFEAPRSRPKSQPDQYRVRGLRDYDLPVGALANPVSGAIGAGALMNPLLPTTSAVTGGVFNRGYAGLLDIAWSGHANSFANSLRLAYLEGVERYAGTHRRRPGPPLVAPYAEVADRALDPTSCGVYTDETYDADPMVRRFDPSRPIPWIWGHRMRSGEPVLVPRRFCFYLSAADGDNFVLSSSSGCATGGCLEEAILYGLLELIERDAFVLGWYGRERLRRIDLDSCDSAAVRTMVDRATLAGYDVLAFDNRIDLTVPVVTTVAARRDGGTGLLSFAAAAHLAPERAVAAALSETLTYIPLKRRTTLRRRRQLEAMAEDYALVETVHDHADLFGLPAMREFAEDYLVDRPLESMAELYGTPRPPDPDLRQDLQGILDELYGKGYDVIVVDQTTPEQFGMGLRTVCTIVPGLLPIDFGWRRQRALTMPRLERRLRERGAAADGPRLVPHPFP